MNRTRIPALLIAASLLAAPALAESWTGWITDEHCGASGAEADHLDCLKKCRENGHALVFYDNASQKIFKLSSEEAAEQNMGHEVVVHGTLSGDTIEVESIEAAASEESGADG